ncbi:Transcription factor bHLH69 [Platanthera zijinensis]|uniref:Transcription factor bHLH69 n=1 Tax=Platanthera zijinensis TaxID=2320716 RepID=A0AAP0B4G1_9ASPA
MLPLQHQFTDSRLLAIQQSENYAIVHNTISPFNIPKAFIYDANLYPDIIFPNPRPLDAITAGEMLDKSVLSLASLGPVKQELHSPLNTGSSAVSYLNSQLFPDTDTSRVDQLIPAVNPLDTGPLSKALCPVAKVESFEDFTLPRIGCPLPNTQGEQSNILNDVESQAATKSDVLMKRKSVYSSTSAQQSEEIIATKARSRKVLSGRVYRAKVAEAIKALKSTLPYSEMGNQTSVLDNVIDYIKFLKLRLHVLNQNRLNGEASAHSFVHLEGYGHYLLHPQTYRQPLEEMVGLLLQSSPQAGEELLQYKGLAIVPMDSAYTILESTLNPFPLLPSSDSQTAHPNTSHPFF